MNEKETKHISHNKKTLFSLSPSFFCGSNFFDLVSCCDEREKVCVCVRDREKLCVCERVRVRECVIESACERVCVCVRERVWENTSFLPLTLVFLDIKSDHKLPKFFPVFIRLFYALLSGFFTQSELYWIKFSISVFEQIQLNSGIAKITIPWDSDAESATEF